MPMTTRTFLRLMLPFATFAAACATGGPDANTVDTWAKKVCHMIEALPPASSSSLPPSVAVTVTVIGSQASATVHDNGVPIASASASVSP